MRVHLIKKQTLQDFALQYPASRIPLRDWTEKLKLTDWKQPGDIKNTFTTSDLLGKSSNRVVFDIGGNNYRIICKYLFGKANVHLYVCWMGSHSAYDKICKQGLQYTIKIY